MEISDKPIAPQRQPKHFPLDWSAVRNNMESQRDYADADTVAINITVKAPSQESPSSS